MDDAFTRELNSLPQEALWNLERAEGYLYLKMTRKARECLEPIAPALHSKGPILQLRMQIAHLEGNWTQGAELAQELCGRYADTPGFWVQHAYAVRRASSMGAAEKILKEAVGLFPDEAIFYYNLGCYAAVAGRTQEAERLLEKAIKLDPAYVEMGLEDEDLHELQVYLESFVH